MNFARLNHILIPGTKEGRDRFRDSRLARLLRPLGWVSGAFSPEGRILLLLTVMLALTAVNIATTQVYWLWCAFAGLLFGTLIVRRLFRLEGVDVEVQSPPRVAVGESVGLVVTLHNRSQRDHLSLRIDRPFLPWDGRWQGERPVVPVLPARDSCLLTARATFLERGHHSLDAFQVVALLPLGLGHSARKTSNGSKIMVIPRLANVTRVKLGIEAGASQQGGRDLGAVAGQARELLGVRPYRPGDAIRDLHARTWARTGQPHVREYHEPVPTLVLVILDHRGQLDDARFEASVSLTAGIVAWLERQALRVTLLVGDERVDVGRGHARLELALDALGAVAPTPDPAPVSLAAARGSGPVPLGAVLIGTDPERLDQWRAALEEKGVSTHELIVANSEPEHPRGLWVPSADIAAGRPLTL